MLQEARFDKRIQQLDFIHQGFAVQDGKRHEKSLSEMLIERGIYNGRLSQLPDASVPTCPYPHVPDAGYRRISGTKKEKAGSACQPDRRFRVSLNPINAGEWPQSTQMSS
ncbi:MAG: hypothetical protein Q4B17_08690 [Lautropia sp.]|nr:hypothetical protein [Lautropia sp.]